MTAPPMAIPFPIVDPHVHLWDPRNTPRPATPFVRLFGRWPRLLPKVAKAVLPAPVFGFLGRPDYVIAPHLPPDLRAAAGSLQVDTIVHIETEWTGRDGPAGETRWLERLPFEAAGLRLGAQVGHAELTSRRLAAQLDAHARASARFRGVRHIGSNHPSRRIMAFTRRRNLFADADFLRGFELLAQRGLRFDAWIYSHQLGDVAALARRFPETPIVLDHLGTPVGAAGPVGDVGATEGERASIVAAWRDGLSQVAEHSNVHAKISGLGMPVLGFGFHTRSTPPSADELAEGYGPFVRHALDVFGVERCFCASNYPMDKVSAPYHHIFDAFARLASERGPEAPRALLRENALRFYGV
jgi:predicted TIM-barrel fold metal-dependent hydrolase